jgi:hypothetical protein
MELRGHTLRDQPLSYQSLFSRPFSERFVVMRWSPIYLLRLLTSGYGKNVTSRHVRGNVRLRGRDRTCCYHAAEEARSGDLLILHH